MIRFSIDHYIEQPISNEMTAAIKRIRVNKDA